MHATRVPIVSQESNGALTWPYSQQLAIAEHRWATQGVRQATGGGQIADGPSEEGSQPRSTQELRAAAPVDPQAYGSALPESRLEPDRESLHPSLLLPVSV